MPDKKIDPLPALPASAVVHAAGSQQASSAKQAVPAPISLSEASVRVTAMVKRGCFVVLPGGSAVFSIRPADDDAAARSPWSTSLFLDNPDQPGLIEIADGARLIQGLTGIDPGLPQAPGTERRQWYAAALAGRLAGTPFAGSSIAAPAAGMNMDESCCLRLTLRSRHHMLNSLARAPLSAWLAFLSRSDWSFERSPVPAWLATESQTTIRVARHTLPARVLRTLALGDVIVPDSPLFGPDGQGRMRLGHLHAHVRYVAPNGLELLELERKMTSDDVEYEAGSAVTSAFRDPSRDAATGAAMDDAGDEVQLQEREQDQPQAQLQAQPQAHNPAQEPAQAQAADTAQELFAEAEAAAPREALPFDQDDTQDDLDAVPVTLSFELGKVSLPLAELRTLGRGAVVQFTGGSPASLAIVASGQTLGRGELVEVAGQLGIRVTQWRTP